jgi:PadR family transcriptional regulator, regulatory protein AphA
MNVRTLCLGILSFREASGYEIKKEIEEGQFSHFIDASYGSIYPALTQLHTEALVTVRAEEQSGRPDKKVYAITELGRKALSEGLAQGAAKDKYKSEFLFAMLLQEYLTEDQVAIAIEKQLHDLKQKLDRMETCRLQGALNRGSQFLMGYGEAVVSAGIKFLEQHMSQKRSKKFEAAE